MKFGEFIKTDPRIIYAKLGDGPYFYYNENGELSVATNFEAIVRDYQDKKDKIKDLDIYCYGYKADASDTHEYIASNEADNYFRHETEKQGAYQCVGDDDIPVYYDLETIEADLERGKKYLVNGIPIDQFVQEERKRKGEQK